MTEFNQGGDPRARGQALRSARAARARSIRRRIVAGSVALFVAAWLMITLVLVSGRDPALAKKSSGSSSSSAAIASTLATTTSASDDTSTSASPSGDTSTSTSGSSSSNGSSSAGASSVTTSQS